MKKIILGVVCVLALPLLSHAEESRGTAPMGQTQIEYIMKLNCDTFTGDMKNYCLEKKRQATLMQGMLTGSGNGSSVALPPPRHDDNDRARPPMGSGAMMGSGMIHDNRDGDRPKPPRPPMGSGAMMGSGGQMERDSKGLMLAIGALSPADREALMKMIKDYLVSKGIDPAKYAEKRDEIKEVKKETRQEVKDMRQMTREEVQKKRDEMQAKIKEMRGNGKATFKEFTVTK